MTRKVYIAGKITGEPEFKEKFNKAKENVEKCGDIAISPADLPAGMAPGDYMRICLAMVDSADEVHMLPSYMESKGATIERLYAQYIGKEVVLMGDEMYAHDPVNTEALEIMRKAVE